MFRSMLSLDTKSVNLAEIEFLYPEEILNIYSINIYWVLSMCQSPKKWIRIAFSPEYCDCKNNVCTVCDPVPSLFPS